MKARSIFLAIGLITLTVFSVSAGDRRRSSCDCRQKVVCPQCDCVATIEEATIEKHCYEVEREQICIPKVRIPWCCLLNSCKRKAACCDKANCSETRCGTMRTVRVLKKETYECPACECKWTPVCSGRTCRDCASGCDSGCVSGCDGGCAGDAPVKYGMPVSPDAGAADYYLPRDHQSLAHPVVSSPPAAPDLSLERFATGTPQTK